MLGIAVLVGGPADVAVQALADSGLFRIDQRILTTAGRRDAAVAWALAEELNRRLYEALQQTAVNTFGSVRQRIAGHLLDIASAEQRPNGKLIAPERLFICSMKLERLGPGVTYCPACQFNLK